MRTFPRLLSLGVAGLGGFVTTFAFPDVGWWPAAFVGVGMLMVAVERDSARWAALAGAVWGTVFFAVHIWWAAVATAVVPWIALTLLQAVFVAGAMAGYVWARRTTRIGTHPVFRVATFVVCFVAGELTRSMLPFGGFPWGRLAFSQAASPLGRLAVIGGETVVGLAVVLVGAVLAVAVLSARVRVWALAAGVVVVVVGGSAAIRLDVGAQDGTLKVGAVQGNVAEPGLGSFANRGEVLDNHVAGTQALLDQVDPGELDVVLWPENGSDLDPQTTPDVADKIDVAARAVGAPILVGAQEYPSQGGRYNVALLWQPGPGVVDRYAKQHPAPFGEYIPMRSFVRMFSDQVDRVSIDMIPGGGVGIVTLPRTETSDEVVMGTLICFEVAYEPLVYDSVQAGAEILVIPTNNASFGMTAESTQQLAMSRLRAIETGRSTVQISTVGVSAIILPDGSTESFTELFTPDQLVAELPLRTSITFAVNAGSAPVWTILGLAVVAIATGVASRVRARRRAGRTVKSGPPSAV